MEKTFEHKIERKTAKKASADFSGNEVEHGLSFSPPPLQLKQDETEQESELESPEQENLTTFDTPPPSDNSNSSSPEILSPPVQAVFMNPIQRVSIEKEEPGIEEKEEQKSSYSYAAGAPENPEDGTKKSNPGIFQLQENASPGLKTNPGSSVPNNTGLPDTLKSGVESLSGYSMDDVKVHYNSSQPAQLNAHAYAQGTDIHLGPGQEKHLPHEAWHVVQQKQGRVKPTMQMKGKVNVNDEASLEREADIMGGKATQLKPEYSKIGASDPYTPGTQKPMIQAKFSAGSDVIQRVIWDNDQWREQSKRFGRKRSPALQRIDAILSQYNQHRADPQLTDDVREQYLIDIQEAINAWKYEKISDSTGEVDSIRSDTVDTLENQISEERNRLMDNLDGNIAAGQIANDFTHVGHYGMPAHIDYTGFEGESATAMHNTRQELDENSQRTSSDMEVILEMLRRKIQEASQHMTDNPDTDGQHTLGVLTAPEWFFMRPRQPFSDVDKRTIITRVKAMSTQVPNMVIMPGSILWTGTAGDGSTMLKNTAFSVMNGNLLHEVDKYAEGLDIKPYVRRVQSEDDPNRTVADPADTVRKRNQWTAGGGRMNEHRGTTSNEDQTSLFNVGNVSFSVEICADHNAGRARQEMLGRDMDIPTDGVHVQVLLSAGAMPNESNRSMRTGGIGLQNDATSGGVRNTFAGDLSPGNRTNPNPNKTSQQGLGGDLRTGDKLALPKIKDSSLIADAPTNVVIDSDLEREADEMGQKTAQMKLGDGASSNDETTNSDTGSNEPIQLMPTRAQWESDSNYGTRFRNEVNRSTELQEVDQAVEAFEPFIDDDRNETREARRTALSKIRDKITAWKQKKGDQAESRQRWTHLSALFDEVTAEIQAINDSFQAEADQRAAAAVQAQKDDARQIMNKDSLDDIQNTGERATAVFARFLEIFKGNVKYATECPALKPFFTAGGTYFCQHLAHKLKIAFQAYGLDAGIHQIPGKAFLTKPIDANFIHIEAVGNVRTENGALADEKRWFFSQHYVTVVNGNQYFDPTSGVPISANGNEIIEVQGFENNGGTVGNTTITLKADEQTDIGGGVYIINRH